jgi:hypothetical protein
LFNLLDCLGDLPGRQPRRPRALASGHDFARMPVLDFPLSPVRRRLRRKSQAPPLRRYRHHLTRAEQYWRDRGASEAALREMFDAEIASIASTSQ